MPLLDPSFDLEAYFARLRTVRERVLLLDYDGAIAPFRSDPGEALPYPEVSAFSKGSWRSRIPAS